MPSIESVNRYLYPVYFQNMVTMTHMMRTKPGRENGSSGLGNKVSFGVMNICRWKHILHSVLMHFPTAQELCIIKHFSLPKGCILFPCKGAFNSFSQFCHNHPSKNAKVGHYWLANETSFKWRFAGDPWPEMV